MPSPEVFLHGSARWDDTVSEALERGRVDTASLFPPHSDIAPASDNAGHPSIDRTPLAAAIRDAEAAVRQRPTDHLLLGVLLARAGMPTAAERELTEYLRTHPNDGPVLKLLASTRVPSEGK